MNCTKINAEFVEKFGELEKLCNDIYSQKHGVSCYIDDMINMQGKYNVKDWNNYLKKLKEARHKRNKLTHGEVGFSEKYILKEDIEFVEQFRKLLLKKQDPISIYYQKTKRTKPGENENTANYKTVILITVIIVLFCIIGCVLYNIFN